MSEQAGHSVVTLRPLPWVKQTSPSTLRLFAPAKINLNLLVGPRQADGYHFLDSFVVRISLYDQIDVRHRDDDVVAIHCEGADCGPPEDNLAVKAARLIIEYAMVGAGVDIFLKKYIPPGRGLGGGSSDAAYMLAGLNMLWKLNLPHEVLRKLAAQLGSDVPLFLNPPAVRMTGRGDQCSPIYVHPFVAILFLPVQRCVTAEVYQAFDRQPAAMMQQFDPRVLAGSPPSYWRGYLYNQLAGPARQVCPAIGEIQDRLAPAAGIPVHMTGSGSAMFMLCDNDAEAQAVLARIPEDLRRRCAIVQMAG